MANVSITTWNVVPPNRLPGDDGQILIVDREDGPNGRTVCIIVSSQVVWLISL